MEIVIIVGAIGFVFAYIWLTPKTPGQIVQKKNPGFKSSLRHNPECQTSEEVFRVLKEANLTPCFLASELQKQQETHSASLFHCDNIKVIYEDREILFNPQSKDGRNTLEVIQDGMEKLYVSQSKGERNTLKVVQDGIKKIDKIEINPQKDIIDSIEPELLKQLSPNLKIDSTNESLVPEKQKGKKLVRKLTSPNKSKN